MTITLVQYLPLIMFGVAVFLLFCGFPVAFVLGGTAFIFGTLGIYVDVFSWIQFYNIEPRIWGGIAANLILVAVPMFIFMGIMLEKGGVASTLLHAMQIIFRRMPGSLALSVTAFGTLMAAATGITGASAIMLTVLALPVMLKERYSKALSTGCIAAASTLGILIPPSIMLVVIGALMSISVGKLFFAAVLPGLLLSATYMLYVILVSIIKPDLAPPLTDDRRAEDPRSTLRIIIVSFIPPSILIFLVLGSIYFGWATPTEAAGVGALGATLLALFNRQLNWAVMKEVVERSASMIAMVFMIMIGASLFSYVFRALGGAYQIQSLIEHAGLGPWGLLLAVMLLVFLMGFFFDWIEITLIVMPIFLPIISTLDFGGHVEHVWLPYWFAILFAVNLQTAFLSPPFGYALFFIKGAAPPDVSIGDIYRGVVPFMALQVICLVLLLIFPQIALWLPQYMQ